ncbi:hypothetical protein IGB42_03509 [Andreprevotia sp. IGB-42]|uniref:transglutaminase-like domain-containing protein n=1 Tax=Andreprevotia sp. IGB-42 TaxID=2497473 RepID=UPI00135CF0E6|nr:transglutaminase family protein [Andreprevotia sp. IGB-42]KAF0811967.1 hypothetical protein IGB42_03509 [Andreprevotia sp. IGB-42]
MQATDLARYLAASDVIDFRHPQVAALAAQRAGPDVLITAGRCFDWVRDEIAHCIDFNREEVPCSASQTLAVKTGFCFAKSHLLVALWRANGIPAGFGYQRLTLDGAAAPYCLHGFVAAYLPGTGWYRCDARGNKPGIDCRFDPPHEQLAFAIRHPGECTYPQIFDAPPATLVEQLTRLTCVAAYRAQPIDFIPA